MRRLTRALTGSPFLKLSQLFSSINTFLSMLFAMQKPFDITYFFR